MIKKQLKIRALIVCILFIAVFAFGQSALAKKPAPVYDLSGCWAVDIYWVDSNGNYGLEQNELWIQNVADDRYSGCVCSYPTLEDGHFFSAIVDGSDVYITHWDSLTKATFDKKGNSFTGINQAFDADPNKESKTSFATATIVDCTCDCTVDP